MIDLVQLERFRTLVADRLGLSLADLRPGLVEEAMRTRIRHLGARDPGAYLNHLQFTPAEEEWDELSSQLTVGETYFFRDPGQLQALSTLAIPERMASRARERTLRIVSAGASGGEEAYTIAILLHEHWPQLLPWRVVLEGIDLNPQMVKKARAGRYTSWSLRRTPRPILRRYFQQERAVFTVDASVRQMVRFHHLNLLDADEAMWTPESIDILFCRNVLMYFTPQAVAEVMARFDRALAPGGFLFLGHAETLHTKNTRFVLRRHAHGFFHQKPLADTVPSKPQPPTATPLPVPELSFPRSAPPLPHLDELLALFEREHYREVDERLERHHSTDPAVRIIHAAALINLQDYVRAESMCLALLSEEALNPEAHYLAALCREHLGDAHEAERHSRVAAYLDPTFSLPHLHLALRARRDGRPERARQEFLHADELLANEDCARLILFGGGFSRDALRSLCRHEPVQEVWR